MDTLGTVPVSSTEQSISGGGRDVGHNTDVEERINNPAYTGWANDYKKICLSG